MLTKYRKKDMNELLMSSSDFSESEEIQMFKNVTPIPRDNLTQISKEDESSKEIKKEIQPKKFKVVYDTSGMMDEDEDGDRDGESVGFEDIGVSPSDFNHYNQRYVDEELNYTGPKLPLSKNDIPLKPQVIMVRSKDSIKEKGSIDSIGNAQHIFDTYELSEHPEPQIPKIRVKPGSAVDRSCVPRGLTQ